MDPGSSVLELDVARKASDVVRVGSRSSEHPGALSWRSHKAFTVGVVSVRAELSFQTTVVLGDDPGVSSSSVLGGLNDNFLSTLAARGSNEVGIGSEVVEVDLDGVVILDEQVSLGGCEK